MSHIPNNAMPHAQSNETSQQQQGKQDQGGSWISSQASSIAELVRENPKTAIAAGAAVIAGAAAAVAVPMMRGRGEAETGKAEGGKSSSK